MAKGGEKLQEELFDLPEGFVGWTGNINQPVPMFKMYGSRISPDFVAKEYGRYARSVGMKALTIHPNRAGETVKDVSLKPTGPSPIILTTKNSQYPQLPLTVP